MWDFHSITLVGSINPGIPVCPGWGNKHSDTDATAHSLEFVILTQLWAPQCPALVRWGQNQVQQAFTTRTQGPSLSKIPTQRKLSSSTTPCWVPTGMNKPVVLPLWEELRKGVQVRADQNPQPQKRKFAQKNVWPLETVFNQGFLVFTVHQKLVGNLLKILIPGFHALRWWFKLA